jgi:hypothetical protein
MRSDQSVQDAPAAELILGLRDKYQALLVLRVHKTDVAPRAEMAALAAAYPGALRELDQLPLPVIERRLAALRAVAAGSAHVERWMTLQLAYHGYMRAVLRLRRALLASGERSFADPLACLRRHAYTAALDEPEPAWFTEPVLQSIVRPPRGRLNPWVMQQVARDQSVSAQDVLKALFSVD